LIGRYNWFERSPFKGRYRRGYSFADESACLSDSLMLGIEAQRVISLRLAAIARGGPTAEAETRLMVTEKMVAAQQAAGMLAQGASTRSVISFYRSRVQENARRLTQKPPLLRRAKQKLWDSFKAMTSRKQPRQGVGAGL
jgi:hypothetical protein